MIANLLDATAADVRATVGRQQAVVSPVHVPVAEPSERIIAVAGYPTGRHHSLIKAAEARLAVQQGAVEVWVAVDGSVDDQNAHLAELAAIREACPLPVALGVFLPTGGCEAVVRAAELAGFQRLIVACGGPDCATSLEVIHEVPGGFA